MSEALKEGNYHSRDKSRSPMQWSDDEYAGFSIVKPWIKIQENYKEINVQRELRSKNSILNDYKRQIALRNSESAFQYGEFKDMTLDNNKISYKRAFGESEITVILNFGQKTKNKLPKDAEIMMGKTTLLPNKFIIYRTKKR
jgi:trehalose-6-phosphate hydrolase